PTGTRTIEAARRGRNGSRAGLQAELVPAPLQQLAQFLQLAPELEQHGARARLLGTGVSSRRRCRRARQCALAFQRTFAQQLLYALDGVALIVEALPDAAKQHDVVGPVVAPSAGALQRFHL